MLGLFFETAVTQTGAGASIATILAMGLILLVLLLLVSVGLYIFSSLIFVSLARKAGDNLPNLAWIPGVGPLIIVFRASKMHWWPWLLLVGIVLPFVGFVAILAFVVFEFIWLWKLFEAVGRPGWWALLLLIPIVGIIMLAVAAWGNSAVVETA